MRVIFRPSERLANRDQRPREHAFPTSAVDLFCFSVWPGPRFTGSRRSPTHPVDRERGKMSGDDGRNERREPTMADLVGVDRPVAARADGSCTGMPPEFQGSWWPMTPRQVPPRWNLILQSASARPGRPFASTLSVFDPGQRSRLWVARERGPGSS